EARQAVARRYDVLLDEYRLGDVLAPPPVHPQRRHTFNQYVVSVANGQRDGLVRHLKSEGIGCEIYYPVPLHLQDCLSFLGYREGDFPISESASHAVLALPMFPELTMDQQRRVIQSCASYLRQRTRRAA